MKKIIYLFLGLLFSSTLSANNLQITNVSTVNQNEAGGYTYVNFDISWDNSWHDGGNWDAAWVFIKVKSANQSTWQHAALGSANADHTAPVGAAIDVPFDGSGKGVYIFRSVLGSGRNNFQNVQLRWYYQQNGLISTAYVDIKVLGIEMVYVPQGPFYAGDGTSIPANFRGQFSVTGSIAPFNITSENAITLGGSNPVAMQNHNLISDDFSSSTSQILPPSYPKGFNAFYCMKYPITQEQYVDFLNMLTLSQQAPRIGNTEIFSGFTDKVFAMSNLTPNGLGAPWNNGIKCPNVIDLITTQSIKFYCDFNDNGVPNEEGDGQNIACNLLLYRDIAAYADWACMRPISELEYEKACRGPVPPVVGEYAWGNADFESASGVYNEGRSDETPINGNSTGTPSHPYRVGSFAKSNSTRFSSGASFYGIMNLSDATDYVINIGTALGRAFSNISGDGVLGTEANVNTWPTTLGSGFKGSIYSVSDRSNTNTPDGTRRSERYGRLVRTP